MESLREGLIWWVTVTVMLTCMVCRSPHLHKVGGQSGWTKDVNYTEWASHERFYVGDWLLFLFDKHYFNVLEVNKTSYEQCNDRYFITNITRGGRDVFNLTQARPYYFLSSGGYCFNGMKMAISVEEYVDPAPAPAPAKNGCQRKNPHAHQIILSIVSCITLVWSFLLKLP